MEPKTDKILGYTLLGVGLLFILLSANSVYTVFIGASDPPQPFKLESIVVSLNNPSGAANSVELVSGKNASDFINKMFWYILMFFLVQVGAKIAGLGIQLVKEIRVTVRSKDGLTTIPTE